MPNPLDRIRAYVPAVVRQNEEFQAAVDDELDAEVALLQEAIDLARPALPYLGGPMPNGARGLLLGDEGYYLGDDGTCYALEADTIVPVTPADVLETRHSLYKALESIAGALEQGARGKLSKRTTQAKERTEVLRAVLRLIRPWSGD